MHKTNSYHYDCKRMSQNFEIKVEREATNAWLSIKASCNYKGGNQRLRQELGNKSLAQLSITFYKSNLTYHGVFRSYGKDGKETKKQKVEYDYYNGFMPSFYNNVTGYGLYKRYPFLSVLKGISHVLLLCCICEALQLEYITKSSEIALEASGSLEDPDIKHTPEESMTKLVAYYEKLGFYQMFPQYYHIGIADYFVPMIATVEDLINKCNFDNVSPELLRMVPVKMCKEYCSVPAIPPYVDVDPDEEQEDEDEEYASRSFGGRSARSPVRSPYKLSARSPARSPTKSASTRSPYLLRSRVL